MLRVGSLSSASHTDLEAHVLCLPHICHRTILARSQYVTFANVVAEKGLGGDVMYGPIHKRLPYFPFAGFPAGTLNAFGFSTELNVTDDTPKNPVVQDTEACKKVYEKTIEVLKSKNALTL